MKDKRQSVVVIELFFCSMTAPKSSLILNSSSLPMWFQIFFTKHYSERFGRIQPEIKCSDSNRILDFTKNYKNKMSWDSDWWKHSAWWAMRTKLKTEWIKMTGVGCRWTCLGLAHKNKCLLLHKPLRGNSEMCLGQVLGSLFQVFSFCALIWLLLKESSSWLNHICVYERTFHNSGVVITSTIVGFLKQIELYCKTITDTDSAINRLVG